MKRKKQFFNFIWWTIPAFLLLFLCLTPKSKFKVSGQITYTVSHCGGAVPTPQKVKEMETPKPFKGMKYFVRKGKTNSISSPIISEFTTDDKGAFQLQLPSGTYCVVSSEKKDKVFYNDVLKQYSKETEHYTAIDKKCLDQWIQTPDFTFEITHKDTSITHNYKQPCSWNKIPCANFKGPFPP